MVTDDGQLYTIEGVAAAVLMVLTAYFILSSTSILTPGDTHINDMHLEQMGNDVLKMMDTAPIYNDTEPTLPLYDKKQSYLEVELSKDLSVASNRSAFTESFISNFSKYAGDNNLKVSANISYRDGTEVKYLDPFWDKSIAPPVTYRDHYVKVTKWVHLNDPSWPPPGPNPPKTVLLEVLLWRD